MITQPTAVALAAVVQPGPTPSDTALSAVAPSSALNAALIGA